MIEPEASASDTWSLSQSSARRSLILCVIGALLGLTIAGVGLFTAKGTRVSAVPAEDVAIVNQVPILMSDYVQQLRALYDVSLSEATPTQKREALNGMVREELYVQRGVELGLQSDTIEIREALVGAVEALNAADATMAQPSEAELRTYYNKHITEFETEGVMTLADYILPTGTSAQRVEQAAAALRANKSDPIAHRTKVMLDGEEFYFAARIHLGGRLFAIARKLRSGAVSPPIGMPDGIHLLVMTKNEMPVPVPIDEVRDRLLASFVKVQTEVLTQANERFLHKRADIQLAKGFE
jgi:hypothetical protein